MACFWGITLWIDRSRRKILKGTRKLHTRSKAGDKDIFAAVVCERLPGETAVKRLRPQAGDVYKPEPLVLGCPPQ